MSNMTAVNPTKTNYVSNAYKYDYLSREEERELLEAYKLNYDMDAREKLIHANLGNVINIAREFSGYDINYLDLVQEGNVGLIKAIDRFSLDHDTRLYAYAVPWIKSEIFNFIIKNYKIMNIATSKPLRKLFFSLRKHKTHLGALKQHEILDIAHKLNVKPEEIKMMEERLMPHAIVSFETPSDKFKPTHHNTEIDVSPKDFIASGIVQPDEEMINDEAQRHLYSTMYSSLRTLDNRSKDIVQRRWLSSEKSTLHELADKYNVSAERIRQIEKEALKKMRTWMTN